MNLQQTTNNNIQEKAERLEARISHELKMRLQLAAELRGSTLTDFVITSAQEAANEVIREHNIIKFSTQDSRAFVNALFNPPKPNKKLKTAYLNYKKEVSSRP